MGNDAMMTQHHSGQPVPMAVAGVRLPDHPAPGGDTADMRTVSGRVKWFDRKRGFGFIVDDATGTDVLIHCSAVEPHGRRELPEGAGVTCLIAPGPKGLHVVSLISFDLSDAIEPVRQPRPRRRRAASDEGGDFVPATIKWFSRVRGYGFVEAEGIEGDVFLHMETMRDAGFDAGQPGDRFEVRVAPGAKGPLAVDIREAGVTG